MVTRFPVMVLDSMSPTASFPAWWGSFDLPVGAWGRWEVGPLGLWVQRRSRDWRIAWEAGTDPLSERSKVELPSEPPPFELEGRVQRFGTSDPSVRLRVEPRTADRPVVTRPQDPFHLPAGDEITMYVTAPLWLRLGYGDLENKVLRELPAFRPSDTWFGPPTEEGELAYAARTVCFLSLEELPKRPHRSISAVRIRNRSEAPLPLERINLPVPRLALFRAESGQLWTQDLLLVRRGATDFAELRLSSGPPRHLGESAEPVSAPRHESTNSIVRAFGSWLR